MRRFFLLASLPFLLPSCIRENASHCGNQAGNSSCADLSADAPFCNICVATNDGCVPEAPPAGCAFGATGAETVSTGSGPTQGGTTPGTNTTPGSGTDASTSPPTATSTVTPESTGPESTGEDSGTTGPPEAVCGDREVDAPFEQCDGGVDEGMDCESVNLGAGELSCAQNCVFDTSQCAGEPECGNGIQEGKELCDPADPKFMQTCEGLSRQFIGGDVQCNKMCTYDTSGCEACIPTQLGLNSCTEGAGECCGQCTCPLNICTCSN